MLYVVCVHKKLSARYKTMVSSCLAAQRWDQMDASEMVVGQKAIVRRPS